MCQSMRLGEANTLIIMICLYLNVIEIYWQKKLLTLDDIIMTLPGVSDNKLNHDNKDQPQFS